MDRTIHQQNVDAFEEYIRAGESGAGGAHKLGFELEHHVVDAETNALVPYASSQEYRRPGVEDVLHELEPLYDGRMETIDINGETRSIGLKRKGAPITLEPGAQVEVSIGPCDDVAGIEEIYRRFRSEIDPVLESMGYKLINLGYHPTACARDIPLIPKHRYAMMNEYFRSTGWHGICMMRSGTSTQVSIDYDDEADAMRKMKVASAIGPLFYMAYDNAPIFEGERVGAAKAAGTISRSGLPIPKRMVRSQIWDDVDDARCMVAPFLDEENPTYRSYAEMLLARPPILTLAEPGDDSTAVYHAGTPASEIYADKVVTTADIEHILSMYFFDVRLKQYIEIRQPDSAPIEYGLSFAALVRGIYYGTGILDKLAPQVEGVSVADIAQAKVNLREGGYSASIYGRPAADWLDNLLELAREGLESIYADAAPCSEAAAERDAEIAYLAPLEDLVARRTTLVEHPAV